MPSVHLIVLSRLDYCNGLLASIPNTHISRLQRLQNWAARLVFNVTRQHDPKPLMVSLHWLPIKQRIVFKLLVCVFKSLNHLSPTYLSNCLQIYQPNRILRSSSSSVSLHYPRSRSLAGDRSFTVSASREWNNLPASLRQINSLKMFKKSLKSFLFC